MPRSNRRRDDDVPDIANLRARVFAGSRRTVSRRDGDWVVQTVTGAKQYVCPGCSGAIEPGTSHLVAWRADSILGDDDALDQRRHWHKRCWEIA